MIRRKKLAEELHAIFDRRGEAPSLTTKEVGGKTNPLPSAWNVESTKRSLAQLLLHGSVGTELLDLLVSGGRCAPIECEILDYKREYAESAVDQAELIKDIASFYNTYGGYLIIGVAEATNDDSFEVVGVTTIPLSTEQLRARLTSYLGTRVMVETQRLESARVDGSPALLDIIFIPKRRESHQPVPFQKAGPEVKPNKFLFQAGAFYYRNGDECIEARGAKILDLQTDPRPTPYLAQENQALRNFEVRGRIAHNLPDRGVICRQFIGRETLIDTLWRWAADDLSHVKVLAGEGGRGKTSIAYEFAEQLSEHPTAPYEQIVWLTAKRAQFSSSRDQFIDMPKTHYSSYETLLRELGVSCGLTDADLDGLSLLEQKRIVKAAMETVPSFVVIDDIDSIPKDDQRKALELGQLLGSTPSKLLLTTRENPSVSADLAVRVPGFTEEEAVEYVEVLRQRISFAPLADGQIRALHRATSGSPLYLESLCRLLRYHTFSEAVEKWRGKDGAAVRAAALEREIDLLSPDSRRCLLTISLMGEASLPELRSLTALSTEKLRLCVDELQALFLVDAPALGEEPRFRVDQTTALLVIDRKRELVADHSRLERRLQELRVQVTTEKGGYDRRVAGVISQAEVLIKQREVGKAFATVEDGISKIGAHKDLLGYLVHLLVRHRPEENHRARILAIDAHNKGCKRNRFLEAWFEAEWAAESFPQAEAIADFALGAEVPEREREWLVRKAASLASQAESRRSMGDSPGAIQCYLRAATSLNGSLRLTKPAELEDWYGKVRALTDQVWSISRSQMRNIQGCVDAISSLERVWRLGDSRIIVLKRMISALEELTRQVQLEFAGPSNAGLRTANEQLRLVEACIKSRESLYPGDERHAGLLAAVLACERQVVPA